MGPRGSKFLGSVMIEVPHVASLRDGDREVIILRCDTAAKNKWSEHKQEEEIEEKILRVRTIYSHDPNTGHPNTGFFSYRIN